MRQCRFFAVLLIVATLALSSCGGGGGGSGDDDGGDTVINISAISGVTPPNYGETPVTMITETDQYTGTVTWSESPVKFAATTVYTATITLTAKPGFTLTGVDESLFKVAGATSVIHSADSGVVTAVFPKTGSLPATVINIATVPGVTAPIYDETPVTTITETVQYTGTVTWSDSPVKFAATTVYTATITLTAKTGYTLNGVSADFFNVAGATSTNGPDAGVVTAEFPVTGPVPTTMINIAAIPGVTPPVLGGISVTTITETDQYTGTVTWSGGWSWSKRFGGQKAYTATITLTAKTGYTLNGVESDFFTVVGSTSDTNPVNSGVVTVVFPATASVGAIGTSALGGKVAYILQSGDNGYVAGEQRGLIAAIADQSTGTQWYNGSDTTTGATGIALGTGQANTTAIVNNQGAGSCAAQLCNDYTNIDTGTGVYSDWYLPSKDELNKLYLNKVAVGGFANYRYWSSLELDAGFAWLQNFDNGNQYGYYKNDAFYVRPVRAF